MVNARINPNFKAVNIAQNELIFLLEVFAVKSFKIFNCQFYRFFQFLGLFDNQMKNWKIFSQVVFSIQLQKLWNAHCIAQVVNVYDLIFERCDFKSHFLVQNSWIFLSFTISLAQFRANIQNWNQVEKRKYYQSGIDGQFFFFILLLDHGKSV